MRVHGDGSAPAHGVIWFTNWLYRGLMVCKCVVCNRRFAQEERAGRSVQMQMWNMSYQQGVIAADS